jgi:hypothetical protein
VFGGGLKGGKEEDERAKLTERRKGKKKEGVKKKERKNERKEDRKNEKCGKSMICCCCRVKSKGCFYLLLSAVNL